MTQPPNAFSNLARRLALALVVCGGLGSLGWLWWNCHRQPEVYYLPRMAPAEWIIYPSAPKNVVNARVEMPAVFQRSFTLERAPETAVLSVAGLRHYALLINGRSAGAPIRSGRTWKQPDEFNVTSQLHAGTNEIAVTVSNSNGPPVLWLSLEAGGGRLNSDESWQASYGGAAWRPARLATDPKAATAGNLIYSGKEPWEGLRARWLTLLMFAILSGAAYWFLSRVPRPGSRVPGRDRAQGSGLRTQDSRPCSAWDLLPLLALAGLWIALFANNVGVLPNLVGYDADGHLAYIQYIQEHHSLPRAAQGWEMFQPPLYYALGAAVLSLFSLSTAQDGGVMALRLMGMLIGIVHFALVWAGLRLLFPGDRAKATWGLLLAGCLPPLLYLSQYVTNEGLAAALESAAVLLTLRMLKQERVSWKACAGLGLCLGAALLTKATALLALPAVFGALLWKVCLDSRASASSPALRFPKVGLALAACLAVCGWHYGRLWAQYGSPFIGVWDPRLGFSWWQDDGYRTSAFYLRFGAALVHPWFSSFKSFGDGLYATLWGDGLLGGSADALARPPWNYDFMAAGYWLAILPTIALLLGALLALATFLRKPTAEWFLLLGLAFLSFLAIVHLSLVLPYQCHVKAFYGLGALVPLCAFGALGFEALGRWSGKLRPAIYILFGVWALDSFAALSIPRSAAATARSRANSLWKAERRGDAVRLLRTSLAGDPTPTPEAQAFLAYLLMETGDDQGARALVETALQRYPDEPKAHLVLAALLGRQEQFEPAIEHARRGLQLGPGSDTAHEQLASLLVTHEHAEEGVQVAREGLVLAPFSPALHADLGAALLARGEEAEGTNQLQLACAIKPDWAFPRLLLAATFGSQGRLAEATGQLRVALRLEPRNAAAHAQLAGALELQDQTAEAVSEYREALRLDANLAAALNNLAWICAAHPRNEFRNGPEAVRLAERACELTKFKEATMVGTLAAAYAEAGQFDEAVATAKKARELALAAGQQDLADKNQKLAELFSARKPYRDTGDR